MNKKFFYFAVATAIVGGAFALVVLVKPAMAPTTPVVVPPEGPISIKGEMVCLPHKNTSGPQTTECAFGLKDDTGRYFALSDTDPNYGNIMGVGSGEKIQVEGTFALHSNTNYQDIGIIRVTKITKLASTEGN